MGQLYTYEQYIHSSQRAIQTLYFYEDFELSMINKNGDESYYLIEKLEDEHAITDRDIFYRISKDEFNTIAEAFNSITRPLVVEKY